MRIRNAFSAVVVAGALTLTGCGGDEDPTSDEATEGAVEGGAEDGGEDTGGEKAAPEGGPGEYEFEYDGATGTILVPTPADDPRVADYEAYREKASADPVTYFVGDIDNTSGTNDINMYGVTVVTSEGEQLEALGVDDMVDIWMEAFADEDDVTNYNEGVDLSNEYDFFLRPGAKGTAILAAEGEMTGDPARVHVMPAGGMDDVEATKVSDGSSPPYGASRRMLECVSVRGCVARSDSWRWTRRRQWTAVGIDSRLLQQDRAKNRHTCSSTDGMVLTVGSGP